MTLNTSVRQMNECGLCRGKIRYLDKDVTLTDDVEGQDKLLYGVTRGVEIGKVLFRMTLWYWIRARIDIRDVWYDGRAASCYCLG